MTGITGTNGKSTTAFPDGIDIAAAGRKSALVGTIEYHVAGKILPAPHTTPEALELNRLLYRSPARRGRPTPSWRSPRTGSDQQRVYRHAF